MLSVLATPAHSTRKHCQFYTFEKAKTYFIYSAHDTYWLHIVGYDDHFKPLIAWLGVDMLNEQETPYLRL